MDCGLKWRWGFPPYFQSPLVVPLRGPNVRVDVRWIIVASQEKPALGWVLINLSCGGFEPEGPHKHAPHLASTVTIQRKRISQAKWPEGCLVHSIILDRSWNINKRSFSIITFDWLIAGLQGNWKVFLRWLPNSDLNSKFCGQLMGRHWVTEIRLKCRHIICLKVLIKFCSEVLLKAFILYIFLKSSWLTPAHGALCIFSSARAYGSSGTILSPG